MWYACLVIIWDLVASIINPSAYLATSSIAASCLYMVFSFRFEYERISLKSRFTLKNLYKVLWSSRVGMIVRRMTRHMTADFHGKTFGHDVLAVGSSNSLQPQDLLQLSEANLRKVGEESLKNRNFVDFFFALVHKEATLRNCLEKMLTDNPFNFNKYMTQLLGNILFISKCRP